MCCLPESEKVSEEEEKVDDEIEGGFIEKQGGEGDVGLSLNLIVKRSRERSREEVRESVAQSYGLS